VANAGKTPSKCQPKQAPKLQQVCSNSDPSSSSLPLAHCKDCNTECSLMGSTHVSPFYSRCSTLTGVNDFEGNYLFYFVPARGQNMK